MSGSFFSSVPQYLPKNTTTRACLLVGAGGIVCLIIFMLLIAQSAQAAETGAFIIASTPALSSLDNEIFISPVPPQLIPSNFPDEATDTAVSVNKASLKELEELPFIGEKKAMQILSGRPYISIEDFFKKNKFSSSQQEKLKSLIKV